MSQAVSTDTGSPPRLIGEEGWSFSEDFRVSRTAPGSPATAVRVPRVQHWSTLLADRRRWLLAPPSAARRCRPDPLTTDLRDRLARAADQRRRLGFERRRKLAPWTPSSSDGLVRGSLPHFHACAKQRQLMVACGRSPALSVVIRRSDSSQRRVRRHTPPPRAER